MTVSFVDVKKSLRSQDPEQVREIIPRFVENEPKNYHRVLQQMMYLSAHERLDNDSPLGLIYMDAIRDLATLYEDTGKDPWPLYRTALNYFCTLPLGEYQKSATTMRPEDMGQIVLVDDFVECVCNGEREQAIHEALKLIWLMDNIFYLVEILTEIAASLDREHGVPLILAGTALKSVDFVDRARMNPLVFLLTDYLSRFCPGRPPARTGTEYDQEILFEPYYTAVFEARDRSPFDILYLSYAQQIWEGVRMKDVAIRRGILRYLDKHFDTEGGSQAPQEYTPSSGSIDEIIHSLRAGDPEKSHALILGYARDDGGLGTLYREMTGLFLESHRTTRPMDLLLLNACRTALAYIQPPEQYQVLLKAADLVMETVAG